MVEAVEATVWAELVRDPAVAGGRVFPVALPEGPVFPAVTYQRVGTAPTAVLRGAADRQSVQLQVDCYAEEYAAAKALAAAVKGRLASDKHGTPGRRVVARWVGEQDGFDTTLDVWRVIQTWRIGAPN